MSWTCRGGREDIVLESRISSGTAVVGSREVSEFRG